MEALAVKIANQDYPGYTAIFRSPPDSLMIEAGLWIELEAIVTFTVGLGLASLMGQRTVPVILLFAFQIIVTPILAAVDIPHLQDLQRSLVGLAVARLEPSGLPIAAGAAGGNRRRRDPRRRRAITATRVGHRGRLRHHRLAGSLDDPRRVANDDQGRLRNTCSSTPPYHEQRDVNRARTRGQAWEKPGIGHARTSEQAIQRVTKRN